MPGANGNGRKNGNGKVAKELAKSRPALVPQPNGRGALLAGGVRGHKGAGGRPPSELRALMRGKLQDRLAIIDGILNNRKTSPSDRLRALDFLARYGLGTRTELAGGEATEPIRIVLERSA